MGTASEGQFFALLGGVGLDDANAAERFGQPPCESGGDFAAFTKQWPQAFEGEDGTYVLDPKNWTKVAEFVKSQTAGITVPMAWFSIYGAIPPSAGGSPIRDEKPFVFDERVQKLLADTYVYLHQAKVIDVDKPAPGALDDSVARKVAQAAKASLPLGIIKAQDVSRIPKAAQP